MKIHLRTLTTVLLSLLSAAAVVAWLNAQITNEIRAHLDHGFIIGNTTLSAGDYTFRMSPDSDLSMMTANSADNKTSIEFLVRASMDDHTPRHSELVFRKYGDREFLSKIYEGGSKAGVAVIEPSKQEERLSKQGQHSTEQSEEQK